MQCKINIAYFSESMEMFEKNDENVLCVMLRNASEHKRIKLSTALLHVSTEIVFNFIKPVSAILFEYFFIAE